jgi:hypothetical protein
MRAACPIAKLIFLEPDVSKPQPLPAG